MIGLVTQQARDAVAAAEALKGRRYREVPDGKGGTRLIPARMGTAPGLVAYDDVEDADETEDKGENGAFKGAVSSFTPDTTLTVQGSGPVTQALAGHVYAAQHHARMPTHLAALQTTEAPAPAGPTFEPGTATVQQQNHRAPTRAFPQVHVPGQAPFHTAPINTGGQR